MTPWDIVGWILVVLLGGTVTLFLIVLFIAVVIGASRGLRKTDSHDIIRSDK